MKKFHIDRLEKLYNFLGTVKPEKFDFDRWGYISDVREYKEPSLNVCGSTACALGWAGSMPEFRKRGLKLKWQRMDIWAGEVVYTENGNAHTDEDAGMFFFGLSADEADELFMPRNQKEGMMPLAQYRRKLRNFIDRKKRQLNIK